MAMMFVAMMVSENIGTGISSRSGRSAVSPLRNFCRAVPKSGETSMPMPNATAGMSACASRKTSRESSAGVILRQFIVSFRFFLFYEGCGSVVGKG